jgi:hypothetical protein
MNSLWTGIVFLLVGASVYAYNTESHTQKITFGRWGVGKGLGETETVAVLLGLGVFFVALGAFRWLRRQETVGESEPGAAVAPDEPAPRGDGKEGPA